MINELDQEIDNLPLDYKSFHFLSSKQLDKLKSCDVLQPGDTNSLGSHAHLVYKSPSHPLLHTRVWDIGLETADRL
ncbi:hypothetical protein K502DRAFT_351633 [Neoconidiobolus thromboides FSU 785]|nr:hypothetical protein K502DRAFT_351633 [Neoconidiobolus thromboides FSU 785]